MAPSLTPGQRDCVDEARALAAAAEAGPSHLVTHIRARGHSVGDRDPYPEALGLAVIAIQDLLGIIDRITGGQS